ncbi:hypothetical protein [Salicola sp. Rm-C-2C1-2]|uniref:hypothetical protein n=1 Tax=Salicola sp. Rm-C-2C1-2 TaxID=3141321 RepID=UPI0032E427FA
MVISANIASVPSRQKKLDRTIESLYHQVDEINLCLNGYETDPYAQDSKINGLISDNSLGDAGKFLFQAQNKGYYFSCDDDIIYPPTYVRDTIAKVDELGVVTYNGRTFRKYPVRSFYRSKSYKYRYARHEPETLKVDFGGTGVMAFDTRYFQVPIEAFEARNMADIWFAVYARSHNVPIWHLGHESGYLASQETEDSIYDEKYRSDRYETEVVNRAFTENGSSLLKRILG